MSFGVPTDFSNANGTNFEPIPADNHVGVCIGVLDMGTHEESFQGGPARVVRKIKVQFELPGVVRTDGKAAIISATYNCSMNEKATFRKVLDAWLGVGWTDLYRGRPWDFLIGLPAMVLVESGPGKRDPGRTVTWIGTVAKFPKGLPAPAPTRDRCYLDLGGKVLPETLSVWDAEKIRQSAEYRAGGFDDRAPKPDASGGRPAATPSAPAAAPAAAPVGRAAAVPGAPAHVAPLLAKYGLGWPYRADDIPDQVTEEDARVLSVHSVPF